MAEKEQSREDYLEAILLIRKMNGSCRSIDVAHFLGFSKPSVSIAVTKLIDAGLLTKAEHGELMLTDEGMDKAAGVLEKHQFFCALLTKIGVNPETANADACRMEHVVSEESFSKLKEYFQSVTQ